MKRAGNLFEGVVDFGALGAAARRAARRKRLTREAAHFLLELEPEVLALERELARGTYRPGGYRTFEVRDPKPRTISAAPFRDRVVHHALCAGLEPVLEGYAIGGSYACRRGKGTLAAIERAQVLARRHPWFLKLDVRRYFETVDHAVLEALLRRKLKDRRLLALCDRVIEAGAPGSEPGKGLPIGNLTSQHFANFYLGALDHHVVQLVRPGAYVRYMDDLLLLGADKATLRIAEAQVTAFLAERLGLEIKREASRLAPVSTGVPFLGFRVWPRLVRLDAPRARRFRRRMRCLEQRHEAGALDEAAWARSAAGLCGWAEHADTVAFRVSFLAGRPARKDQPGQGEIGLEPGQTWRQLEQQRAERACGQSQQHRAVEPQQQPRSSPLQLTTTARRVASTDAAPVPGL
jgi:hypothetical protein